ncbi:TetR family transcriptional regulator [Branchiibius hedensis]|uniref:DNA-binding transcriptional regulator, AcrR family n=1 Tax=Branchiibius hedensis TaxID=672460 RepID=A0A2Y9BT41_9MICO|nr:TetR family transcriptional regulator [Branchiibius hedensis]PWJ24575.1 TetR family transcriptional regulator [Branchiibius hedensis]SSA33392.1 DNA-binding transcriptional regulator, AcrR family [Branchiibius hedensis]
MAEHNGSLAEAPTGPSGVGPAIRRARRSAGLSLRSLAAQLGVSPATMSALENDLTPVTVQRLIAIADALGVDPAGIVADAGPDTIETADPTFSVVAPGRGFADWRHFGPLAVDPVLAAAIRVFVRTGYHGATMRMIALEAGMSVAGVYHHYDSKYALLVTGLDRTMGELRPRVEAARDSGADPVEKFSNIVEALALFHTYYGDLALIGASEMRSLDPVQRTRIATLRNEIQYLMDEQVQQARKLGLLKAQDWHDAGRAISTMCTSLPQWFKLGGASSPEQIAQEYTRFALGMMQYDAAAHSAYRAKAVQKQGD